jgi:tRNA nucleotidyltransferase/poly(A) polymerase
VKDKGSAASRALEHTFHALSAQNELLQHELSGVEEALKDKKKQTTKQQILPLQQHDDWHGGAYFYSPRARKEAEVRYEVFERLQHEEELAKADRKQLQHNNKNIAEKLKEERRVEREAAALVREKDKAERAAGVAERKAEKERLKQARNAEKALQLSQNGKRKASQQPAAKLKQKRRAVAAVGGALEEPAPPAPPPKTTSRGRNVNLPKKFQ